MDDKTQKPSLVQSASVQETAVKARKIGLFDMWVYKLFYWRWTPILKANPALAQQLGQHMQGWVEQETAKAKAEKALKRKAAALTRVK